MPFTAVNVCNIALLNLAERPISSFDDGSMASKLCGANFHMVTRMVLQAHPWNCATARWSLPQLVDAPAFGYAFQYQLPVDLLYIQKLDIDQPFRREGNRILTDAPAPVYLTYTRDLAVDPSTGHNIAAGEYLSLDGLCANAVAYRLAFMIAKKITGSDSLMQAMFKLYEDAMTEAKSVDASQGTPEVIDGSSWVDVE